MKKILILSVIMLLWVWCSHATDLEDSIKWWYENGLTKFQTSDSFKPNNSLRRDEAAKFFLEFVYINKSNEDIAYYDDAKCDFQDINKSRSDLKKYVEDACIYWFIRWSANYIMPDNKLTNAQAVVILMRIIDGYQQENGTHWSNNYYKRAKDLWLDTNKFYNKSAIATRGNMMILLHNAYMLLYEDRSSTIDPEPINNYPNCDKNDITIGTYTIAACNVWTNKPGTSPYDTDSYWEYYQRGRNTTKESTTISTKEGRNYNIQWPCSNWYHIPNKSERDGIYQEGIKMWYWSAQDWESFAYRLNLPFAGYKTTWSDIIIWGGDRENNSWIGEYRTSTLFWKTLATAYVANFGISYNNLDKDWNWGGAGFSLTNKLPIRCFKDNFR